MLTLEKKLLDLGDERGAPSRADVIPNAVLPRRSRMEMKSEPNSKSPGSKKKFLVALPYHHEGDHQPLTCIFIMRAADLVEVCDRVFALMERDGRAWMVFDNDEGPSLSRYNGYLLGGPCIFDLDTIIEEVEEFERDDDLLDWAEWAGVPDEEVCPRRPAVEKPTECLTKKPAPAEAISSTAPVGGSDLMVALDPLDEGPSTSPGSKKKFLVALPYHHEGVGQPQDCLFIMRGADRKEVVDRVLALIGRDGRAWKLFDAEYPSDNAYDDNGYLLGWPYFFFDLDTIIEDVPEFEGDDDLLDWAEWAKPAPSRAWLSRAPLEESVPAPCSTPHS